MAEKQRMKELTLNINERQEEEDYAGKKVLAKLSKYNGWLRVLRVRALFHHENARLQLTFLAKISFYC